MNKEAFWRGFCKEAGLFGFVAKPPQMTILEGKPRPPVWQGKVHRHVRDVLTEQLGLDQYSFNRKDPITLSNKTTFDSLGADDLDKVELVMALEEHSGKAIPEKYCENINTIGDLANAYKKRKKDSYPHYNSLTQ